MHLAEKIRPTATEGMSMAQDCGNYPPYARNPILIKTYRGGEQECPVSTLLPSCIGSYWPCFPRFACICFFFGFDRKGVWRDFYYFVHKKSVRRSMPVEKKKFWASSARSSNCNSQFHFHVDTYIIPYFFCHQYKASTYYTPYSWRIYIHTIQYTK